MRIQYYPKKMITILTIGILTSNIHPMISKAAPSTQISIFHTDQQEMYSLRPAEFKNVLAQTDSSLNVIKSYVENIQKQPVIHLERIQVIHDNLRSDIIRHQKITKENAANWEEVQKNILETNQNIIQFNAQFQSKYERLSMTIHYKQTGQLQSNIKDLLDLISQNKRKSDQLTIMLQEFQSNIEVDVRNFKKDVNTLIPLINRETGGISDLQNQINANNDIIKKNKDILWELISSGHANANNLADERKKIAAAEANIQKLKASLSGIRSDVAILTDTQNNMINMVEVIAAAIKALREITQQWDIVQVKYKSVLKSIEDIDPEMFELIQSDLRIAKKEWQDLKEYAKQLQRVYENEGSEAKLFN
ncbi:HBL/NHE enterotoxin family protein [Bacillus sp. CDB3]|uniref:HBL/NHE enterotoxin family protein n=1 Tax=Bacillus sp. CDB3 TaxID=360310 RepID=UPI0009D85484|nr:HBL/NHE enterotoxin family protein [Bacillus sp. CDB3]OQR53359.1 hemolytic enterotoxin [Bacillus sp. CDB3]